MILTSKVQEPRMKNNFNPNYSNFQGIINKYFWFVVVESSPTIPTREVVIIPATTTFVI